MFIDPDGVEKIAGLWGTAAEGLRTQRDALKALEMRAETFGVHYGDRMTEIGPAMQRLAGRMHDWSVRFDDYHDQLHGVINGFGGVDTSGAAQIGAENPGTGGV